MKNLSIISEVRLQYNRPEIHSMPQVQYTEEAVEILRSFIDTNRIDLKEFFLVMLLTHSQHILGISEIAIGDTNEVAIPKKEIFQLALTAHASRIILCHNHPSGNINPSPADIRLTKEIMEFGKLIDIYVLDHVILTSESYYSFANEGTI